MKGCFYGFSHLSDPKSNGREIKTGIEGLLVQRRKIVIKLEAIAEMRKKSTRSSIHLVDEKSYAFVVFDDVVELLLLLLLFKQPKGNFGGDTMRRKAGGEISVSSAEIG